MCVWVCEFGNRTSGWHADDDKYDDSDGIMVGSANRLWLLCIMVGSANRLWLLCIIKIGQLAELC